MVIYVYHFLKLRRINNDVCIFNLLYFFTKLLCECLQWEPVEYFNNKIICDLIEAKPMGIVAIMVNILNTIRYPYTLQFRYINPQLKFLYECLLSTFTYALNILLNIYFIILPILLALY